jgi:hypothetical protein
MAETSESFAKHVIGGMPFRRRLGKDIVLMEGAGYTCKFNSAEKKMTFTKDDLVVVIVLTGGDGWSLRSKYMTINGIHVPDGTGWFQENPNKDIRFDTTGPIKDLIASHLKARMSEIL